MKIRRTTAVAALTAFPLALGIPGGGTAYAHGTSQNPPSRIQLCSTQGGENPENFTLPACKAAKAAVGGNPAPFYDPNAVNIAAAAGQHRQLIPNGKLCSAGNPQYAGLDLPRADWPATNLPSGAPYTFKYKATAPHRGTFEYYITKDGFDVTKPPAWSDLEAQPFLTATDPVLESGAYVMKGQIPRKSGRHMIYIVWQRSDSPEAFYSCSDVTFDGSGRPAASTPAAPATKPAGSGTSGGTTGGSSTGNRPVAPSTAAGHGSGDHAGHGTSTTPPATPRNSVAPGTSSPAPAGTTAVGAAPGSPPAPDVSPVELAKTGGESSASVGLLAGVSAAVLAVGAGSLLWARRRTTR